MAAGSTSGSISEVAEFKVALDASVGVQSENLTVAFDATKYGRAVADEADEAAIDEAWKTAKRSNPRLYNGSKFRFAGGTATKDGKATLHVGLTDIKAFRTTNLGTAAEGLVAKGKSAGGAFKFLSDPMQSTIIVESTDGFVPLLQRPGHARHAGGKVDSPVGFPEPSSVGIPLSAVVVSGAPAKARRPGRGGAIDLETIGGEIIGALFDASLAEVADELNLESEKLKGHTFLGVVRNIKVPGALSAVFTVKYAGTLGDLQARYDVGSKDHQSTAMLLAPATQLLAVNTTEPGVTVSGCRVQAREGEGAATPTAAAPTEEEKTAEVNSDDMSAPLKAGLELWRMHRQKLAARRRSTAGFL